MEDKAPGFVCGSPDLRVFALQPRLDLVALDLAGGAARQVRERDEADLLGAAVSVPAGSPAQGVNQVIGAL